MANKKYRPTGFFILVILFLFCFENSAQNDSHTKQIDALFTELSDQTPGAAVIVVQDSKIAFQKNYGLANLEHQIPLTNQTVFDIASISKQFCGMAIAMLIEKRKLDYDDDIRKYIPELNDFGTTITIGHLLHHTSGIRDWTNSLALAGWSFDDVISMDQILDMAYRQKGLNFEPGSEYLYSNTGYNLLAEVVHRISGLTFREWTSKHIFEPLGMPQTHFCDNHAEVIPFKASSYYRGDEDSYRQSVNSLTALGSSSLLTTTSDLAKWVINFENAEVGGRRVIDRMMQTTPLTNGKDNDYAYGLVIGKYKDRPRVTHGGSWAGFRTALHHFPDDKFSVVVLLNAPILNPYRLAESITDIFLKNEGKASEAVQNKEPMEPEIVKVETAILDEYLGTYKLGPGWYVTITREENQLITTATNEPSFPMKATSQTDFLVPDYGDRYIRFRRDESDQVSHFEYNGMHCPKMLDGPTEIQSDLQGSYFSQELLTTYEISVDDGKLVAKHMHNGNIELIPMWEGEFAGERFYMGSVHFNRDQDGHVVNMEVSSGRSRNQIFEKMKP